MGISEKPNIVLIVADDMGYGDLSCYGATKINTPNMDSIAHSGIRFTDAHATSAVCTPSRYGIMTGRYCWKTKLKKWVLQGFGEPIIEEGRTTIASMLKEQGYNTAAIGKWHLGLGWKDINGNLLSGGSKEKLYKGDITGVEVDYTQGIIGGPTELGFDYFYGISGSLDMPPYCFIENNRTLGIPNESKEPLLEGQKPGVMTSGWKDDQVDIAFANKAVDYILENKDKDNPFFMYITPAAPHRPCVPPRFIQGKSEAGYRGDAVVLVDWLVGRVKSTLEATGLLENTIIMLTSDNGGMATDVRGQDYGHHANGQLRGQKADIWEGGHRIPLLMMWPQKIEGEQVIDQLISLSDIISTLGGITGANLNKNHAEDSISFAHLLNEEWANKGLKERNECIHHSGDGMFAIRRGAIKYIEKLGSGGFTIPTRCQGTDMFGRQVTGQLYDIEKNIHENTNGASYYPDVEDQMRKLLVNAIGRV